MPKYIYPDPSDKYDPFVFSQLVQILRLRDDTIPETPASVGWIVSNYTTSRTLDGSTATLADVINFVCTLVNDLKKTGHLG